MLDLKKLILKLTESTPVGKIDMYAGATAPTGWLLCKGQAVSRTTYSALFAIIGTTYGAGNGSSTFNIPDMRNRVPVGAGDTYNLNDAGGSDTISYTPQSSDGNVGNHTITAAQIPSHNHGERSFSGTLQIRQNTFYAASGFCSGAYSGISAAPCSVSGSGQIVNVNFSNAHTHDSVGSGGAHTHSFTGKQATLDVRQPYRGINFIIYTGV